MIQTPRKPGADGADPAWTEEQPEAGLDATGELTLGSAIAVAEVDPTGRLDEPAAGRFHWGTGRRKSSVARVRIRPGSGQFVVNGKVLAEYLPNLTEQITAASPARDLKVTEKLDVFVSTFGGGPTGQSGAIRMGLARALGRLYPDAHEFLRHHGHLTRDPRMVERKKYGRAGARRSFQWVKR